MVEREAEILGVKEPAGVYKSHKDFTSLRAWEKLREVKLFFYRKVVTQLPKEERFNLELQIRKAAVSVTANVAEGYGRYHHQEAKQFYRIARASCYELKDHLLTCYDLRYITSDLKKEGLTLIESAKITLNGYISYVTKQKGP